MKMMPFGKKGASASRPPAPDRVRSLSQQGYSEAEIIRTLRTEGYSPSDADSAMKQAVRSAALPSQSQYAQQPYRQQGAAPLPPMGRDLFPSRSQEQPLERDLFPERQPERSFERQEMSFDRPERPLPPRRALQPFPERQEELPFPEEKYESEDLPELPEIPRPEPAEEFIPPMRRRLQGQQKGEMEEVAEGLMEEKWGAFQRQMNDFEDKLDKVEGRMNALENSLSEIKGVKRGDVEEIKTSINSYKEHLTEISERIEAMELAVKDSLTPMMQSLRSLSDTLKTMRTAKQ